MPYSDPISNQVEANIVHWASHGREFYTHEAHAMLGGSAKYNISRVRYCLNRLESQKVLSCTKTGLGYLWRKA
jgi:hypothetical protein